MTTSGVVTDYDIRALSGKTNLSLTSLTLGPDGNIWFSAKPSSSSTGVGYLNISTGSVAVYGSGVASYGDSPSPIVAGSDGNLWYYVKNAANNKKVLLRVNPSSGTTTTTFISDTYSIYSGLVSSPDGKLWVMNEYSKRLTSFSVSTGVMHSSHLVPSTVTSVLNFTPDVYGNLWFSAWLAGTGSGSIFKLDASSGVFTEHTLGSGSAASNLTTGSDGAIWFFNNSSTPKIGRITASGSISNYTIPGSSLTDFRGMTLGPDEALWFTYKVSGVGTVGRLVVVPDFTSHPTTPSFTTPRSITTADVSSWYIESTSNSNPGTHIARMTTSGVVTDYDVRTLSGNANLSLVSLTTGPDGNVWFSASLSGSACAGYLNVSTGTVTLYGNGGIQTYSTPPSQIVTGSDGNLWYYVKNAANNKKVLLRVNPSSGTTTTTYTSDTYSNYSGLMSSPDGKLWLTDEYYKRLISFSVSTGTQSGSYNLPTSVPYTFDLVSGPDGNVWFSASTGIFRFNTTSGVFTEYTLASGSWSYGLTNGSDGAIWFINNGSTPKIGRITTSGNITEYTVPGSNLSDFRDMTLGSDGAVWFTYKVSGVGTVGRLGY